MLLALSVALPLAFAQGGQVNDYNDYAGLEIAVTEEASIIAESDAYGQLRIDSLTANLSLIPFNDQFQVVSEQVVQDEPKADVKQSGDSIFFSWKDPRAEKFKYIIRSRVKTLNKFPRVWRESAFFPVSARDFPKDVIPYTKPTPSIDINEGIRRTATGIIQGQTDYYKVVFRLADWVQKNIEYNVNPLTEDTVLNASWVLANRQGVCDELTNLFIAMLRSVGIPARFVSGYAYSNVDHRFGSHSWAEVYFPQVGWVPVDVTFRQYGWIDPSHVKMKASADPTETQTAYAWRPGGVIMHDNPLSIRADVVNAYEGVEQLALLSVEPMKDKVAPGSFVPIKVTVKNSHEFYLPLLVQITKASDILGENVQAVLLEPFEERALFWIARMPSNLSEGFIYLATIEAKSTFGGIDAKSVEISSEHEAYTEEWAQERLRRLQPREDKSYLPDVDLNCSLDREYYYREDDVLLACTAKNAGNTNFKMARLCYEANCLDMELLIGDERQAQWAIKAAGIRDPELKVTMESQNLMRYNYLPVRIIEQPKIVVHEFAPASVKYGEKSDFELVLSANETAYNVSINIIGYLATGTEAVGEMRKFLIPFNSRDFRRGSVRINLTYYDELGKGYTDAYSYRLDVTDIPWHIEVLNWIERLIAGQEV